LDTYIQQNYYYGVASCRSSGGGGGLQAGSRRRQLFGIISHTVTRFRSLHLLCILLIPIN
jgi:hypothetical protein